MAASLYGTCGDLLHHGPVCIMCRLVCGGTAGPPALGRLVRLADAVARTGRHGPAHGYRQVAAQDVRVLVLTTANTATTVIMILYYRDLRALYLVPIWFGVQYNICIDAAVRSSKLMIVSLLIGAVYHSIAMAMVAFGLIHDVQAFQISDYGPRALAADDFLVNTMGTIIYMLVRSMYRRGAMLRSRPRRQQHAQPRDVHLVRCVSYRCTVKLQSKTADIASSDEHSATAKTQGQLRCSKVETSFNSRETVLCGRHLTPYRLPRCQRLTIHTVGFIGLFLTSLMFLVLNSTSAYTPIMKVSAIAAPVFTVSYCLVCLSLYHPRLLRHLCLSFDFAFVSTQFIFAHICAGYLYQWDYRACVVVASFCWVLLIITVDALTPMARHKIGFRLWFLVPALLALIVASLQLANEISTSGSTWRLRDFTIFQASAFGHEFRIHVKPAFFNRVWMLLLWECRVLWRILRASSHSLIMIHSAVDIEITSRRRGATCPSSEAVSQQFTTRIAPSPCDIAAAGLSQAS